MKFLLQVGHELDLNVNWDGGGVDNVTYQVSAGSEDIISVTSAGIVEGLAVGTAVVEFVNSNVVVGSAIFEVLTATQMISRQALRDGASTLVVDADEVPAASAFTLVTGGTAIAYRTWEGTQPADAFDGNVATFTSSWVSGMSVTQALIGKQFSAPKQIKKVRFKAKTAPQQLSIEYSTDTNLAIYDGNQDLTQLRGNWTQIQAVTVNNYEVGDGWQEVILPSYTAAIGIMIRPFNIDAVEGTTMAAAQWAIDRFRMYEVEFYE